MCGPTPRCIWQDSILGLLKDRFKKEIVYTYVGDIVVSVNPFKSAFRRLNRHASYRWTAAVPLLPRLIVKDGRMPP
jgi:Myosin heavy chain